MVAGKDWSSSSESSKYVCTRGEKKMEVGGVVAWQQLQRVPNLKTIPEEKEDIVTLRDLLSNEQERNVKLNEQIEVLMKRLDVMNAEKARNDNDNAHLIKGCEKVIEDNQKLKAQIVDLEKMRDIRVKQDLEATQIFLKQVDAVVAYYFSRLKEENQKTSEQNKRLVLKVSEKGQQIKDLLEKDKNNQENIHRLLVENHELESSQKCLESKYKRLEDDYQKLMKKYINMVDKLDEQAKQKEISDKEHLAKINILLKNMDQFKGERHMSG
ncbi:hypothetical protein WDU94_002729 [Cyamophila willieti]